MKTIHIFISHSWKYSEDYKKLIKLLDERKYFDWKDYSVPQDDPIHTKGSDKELYKAIKQKVKLSSIVIILAGVYSTYSKWIDEEIKIAKETYNNPKPILGIKPRGNKNISTVVQDNADKIVNWNTESIVKAIRDLT